MTRFSFPRFFSSRTSQSATRLAGLLTILSSAGFAAEPTLARENPMPFITRQGDKLYEGAKEFRYVSVNMPDVLQIISNYRFDGDTATTRLRIPDAYEQHDAIRTVHQLGGRVLRTFVITSSDHDNPMTMFNVAANPVVAHAPALLALDRLLQIAHEEGVRLLIPLIAYKSSLRGDPNTYGPDFWFVGSATNLKFKNMLAQLLGRTNSLTGIPYRDDPAIFAWQTGNELVMGDDPQRHLWLHDIAAYIKKLAPNQLLVDGRNKPNDVFDRYAEFAADPNIDAVSYHTYVNLPQAPTPAGTLRLIRGQLRGKIPLIVSEVAMYTPPARLRELFDEIIADGTVGANWWGLRFHNRDGGFYKHSDRGSQFEDLNWPGFSDARCHLPEIARERELLGIISEYAARIAGQKSAAPTIPAAPTLLPALDVGHLSWQGSTGADGYQIQRGPTAAGPWTTLAAGFGDNLNPYTPLFCDSAAETGRIYFYRVLAQNPAGISAPSNVIGPLQPDRRWLVDDLFDLSQADPSSRNLAIKQAYANDAFLGDISIAERNDAGQSASLVYRLPGAVREFSVTVYDSGVAPEFFVSAKNQAREKLNPNTAAFDGGKRARYRATPPGSGDTLEIFLPAGAAARQAIGRVEISWSPSP
jgi:hypothetical protein